MVGREPHRQRVESAPAGLGIEQGREGKPIRVEQAREWQDLIREVDQPVLVGPLAKGIGRIPAAEQEIGRLPGFDRGMDLDLAIIVRG